MAAGRARVGKEFDWTAVTINQPGVASAIAASGEYCPWSFQATHKTRCGRLYVLVCVLLVLTAMAFLQSRCGVLKSRRSFRLQTCLDLHGATKPRSTDWRPLASVYSGRDHLTMGYMSFLYLYRLIAV